MSVFRQDGIYLPRVWYWYPWRLTRWWLPKIWLGGDEHCNVPLCFTVPPFGCVLFFQFWRPMRTAPCEECWRHLDAEARADYAPCGWLYGGRVREGAHHHVVDGLCERVSA